MLSKLSKKYDIILASQSPRRKALLQEIVPKFKVQVMGIDEIYPDELKGETIAMYLSSLKAKPFLKEIGDNQLIITSDTIVCLGDEILGKPANTSEAFAMLKLLNGKTHTVITGVTITTKEKQLTFSDTTFVTFYELSDEEIKYYVNKCQPLDKAGSYGIQEWFGYVGIKKVVGEYYNVMGLPIHKLYRELKKLNDAIV